MAAPTVTTIYQSSDIFVCQVVWLVGDGGIAAVGDVTDDTIIAHGLGGIPNDISMCVERSNVAGAINSTAPTGLEAKLFTTTGFTVGKRNTSAGSPCTVRYTLRRLAH